MKPPSSHRPGGSGRPPGGGRGPQDGPPRGNREGGNREGGNRDSNRPGGQRFGGGPRPDRPGETRGEGRGDRPWQARPDQSRNDQFRNDQSRNDRPHNDRPRNDRPQSDRRPDSPRPGFPRPDAQQDRPRFEPRGEARREPTTPAPPRGTLWLYGQHAVAAALANPNRRLRRLILTEEAEATLATILPPPWSLQPERLDRGGIDRILGRDAVHQGFALLADPLAPPSLQQMLDRPGPILVLDQVTDPRNIGAILRSAAAFGAAGIIVQERNAPEETGAMAKAASGALEQVPLIRAVNISRTLVALKAANIWTVGLDAGAKNLAGSDFTGRRLALVLGAEGEGLRRLTKETCDETAGLAMSGAMDSLNVSAAAAVALYEITRA